MADGKEKPIDCQWNRNVGKCMYPPYHTAHNWPEKTKQTACAAENEAEMIDSGNGCALTYHPSEFIWIWKKGNPISKGNVKPFFKKSLLPMNTSGGCGQHRRELNAAATERQQFQQTDNHWLRWWDKAKYDRSLLFWLIESVVKQYILLPLCRQLKGFSCPGNLHR